LTQRKENFAYRTGLGIKVPNALFALVWLSLEENQPLLLSNEIRLRL
jgi:hypothetical protein